MGMYGRIAACAAAAAALGFLSGAAAMTDYVDDQNRGRNPDSGGAASSDRSLTDGFPGADHAVRAVGTPLTQRACEWATFDEARGVPLAHQLSTIPVVTIDAIGGLTGGGECSPHQT